MGRHRPRDRPELAEHGSDPHGGRRRRSRTRALSALPTALGQWCAPRAELDDGPRAYRGATTVTGSAAEHLDHLAFRARCSDSGLGAAVVNAKYEAGHRSWECIAGNPD